jgi:ribosomal protein L1
VDEEALNASTRKFLRKLGVTTQRELEAAIREGVEAGTLNGDETLEVTATVTIDGLPTEIVVPGSIQLS